MRGPGREVLQALALTGASWLAVGVAAAETAPCPPGWAIHNWVDPTVQTPKYVIGRILAKHAHTPAGLREAVPEIQSKFPGTDVVAGTLDILHVPGVGEIDVIAGAGEGGRSWRWHVLKDECAQSGLCSPPHKGPAAPGGSQPGSGGSTGGSSARGRFTCNRWADNAGCWCGEWTDAIWAQRHYVHAHVCRPGFVLRGSPDGRWGDWARDEVGDFIKYMEDTYGDDNRECTRPRRAPDFDEMERRYWAATDFSGFSGSGLAEIAKACKAGGSGASGAGSAANRPSSIPAGEGTPAAAPAPKSAPPTAGAPMPSEAARDEPSEPDFRGPLDSIRAAGVSDADAARAFIWYPSTLRSPQRRGKGRLVRRR